MKAASTLLRAVRARLQRTSLQTALAGLDETSAALRNLTAKIERENTALRDQLAPKTGARA